MAQRRPARDRNHSSLTNTHQQKADKQRQLAHITRALHATPVDVQQLRLVSAHSFLTTAFRQRIWPLLLGLPATQPATAAASPSSASGAVVLPASSYPSVRQHAYYAQVEKDVERSLCHFDVCRGWRVHQRGVRRRQLARVIHTIFSVHGDLHYIQGYHDIVSVLLLTLDDEYATYQAAEHLSLMHIRDSLDPTLDTVVSSLSLIFPLLKLADETLWQLLTDSGVQSFFTLSWVLTWFAHNVDRFAIVQHCFDFFLSSHPSMPIYMVVALILQQRTALLALRTPPQPPASATLDAASATPDEPLDPSAIHALFQSLTLTDTAQCSAMCDAAQRMAQQWPPRLLCGMSDTPPAVGSRVRVGGMEALMDGMRDEEEARRGRRLRGDTVTSGGEEVRGGAGGWKDWKVRMSDELKGKRVREWGMMGVTAVGAALALAAYRMYGVNGT